MTNMTTEKRWMENMIRFYYFVEKNFVPIYQNGELLSSAFARFKPDESLKNELTIEEILDEYFSTQLNKLNKTISHDSGK